MNSWALFPSSTTFFSALLWNKHHGTGWENELLFYYNKFCLLVNLMKTSLCKFVLI